MVKQIYMQADHGRYSRGHVYGVNKRVAARLLRTHAQIQVRRGGRLRTEAGRLAVIATAGHLDKSLKPRPEKPVQLIKMWRDVGKYSAGRTYSFEKSIADRYCDGYKSGGRLMQPIAERVDEPEGAVSAPVAFAPESVLSRRMVRQLADLGFKTAAEIDAARIGDLTKVTGVGPKKAEELKALAKKHVR